MRAGLDPRTGLRVHSQGGWRWSGGLFQLWQAQGVPGREGPAAVAMWHAKGTARSGEEARPSVSLLAMGIVLSALRGRV